METCTNCGAALRPGARFCTTCGTRLNSASETKSRNGGWGTPVSSPSDDAQETTVLEAVQPPATEKSASITGGDSQREYDRWTNAYGSSSTPADDPASRFISALEQTPVPVKTDDPAKSDDIDDIDDIDDSDDAPNPAATWVTPPPDALKAPAASTWSYQEKDETKSSEASNDSGWKAPSSWGNVTNTQADDKPAETGAAGIETADRDEIPAWGETSAEADAADEVETEAVDEEIVGEDVVAPDAAGFHDGGAHEVDYLSGDENIDVNGQSLPALAPEDARARAISLVDELRRMVRLMPGGGMQDAGAAAMALTEASLKVTDFADVREAITELQEDPRDIQALSNLARNADKIELLLDEHRSLAAAIETALLELSGQN